MFTSKFNRSNEVGSGEKLKTKKFLTNMPENTHTHIHIYIYIYDCVIYIYIYNWVCCFGRS